MGGDQHAPSDSHRRPVLDYAAGAGCRPQTNHKARFRATCVRAGGEATRHWGSTAKPVGGERRVTAKWL